MKAVQSVLCCLVHAADDASRIYVVETSSYKNYCGFLFTTLSILSS